MTQTTTIQVRKDQAEQLKDIARENGNYKTVLDRLIENYEADDDLAASITDDLLTQLPPKIAAELRD